MKDIKNMEKEKQEYPLTHEECGCTLEDLYQGLEYLPAEELLQILEEGKLEASCGNCGQNYVLKGQDLDKIKQIIKRKDMQTIGSCAGCSLSCPIKDLNNKSECNESEFNNTNKECEK